MPDASGDLVANTNGEITRLVERLHRRYLDLIRYELSKLGIDEINSMQALLLMNVQDSDVTIRDLVDRGYHVGSNVTYNVRQLVDCGYIIQNRSEHDRRSVRIHATEKGQELCKSLLELEMHHASSIIGEPNDIESARKYLRELERIWSNSIQFGRG